MRFSRIWFVILLAFSGNGFSFSKSAHTEFLDSIDRKFMSISAASWEEEEEEEEEEEDIEHIEIIGTPPDDWDDDWGDDWGDWYPDDEECSNSSVCDGDGDGAGGDVDIKPIQNKEACYALADRSFAICKHPAEKNHLDAMHKICPLVVDVEFGVRYIFGNVAVRSYDSCVNTAAALRDFEHNKCEIFYTDDKYQCATKYAN